MRMGLTKAKVAARRRWANRNKQREAPQQVVPIVPASGPVNDSQAPPVAQPELISDAGDDDLMVPVKEEPLVPHEPITLAPAPPCRFCGRKVWAKMPTQKVLRTKIEYVLATSVDPAEKMPCCAKCWQKFKSFHDFKRACLLTLFQSGASTAECGINKSGKSKNPGYDTVDSKESALQGTSDDLSHTGEIEIKQEIKYEPREEPIFDCIKCHRLFSTAENLEKHTTSGCCVREGVTDPLGVVTCSYNSNPQPIVEPSTTFTGKISSLEVQNVTPIPLKCPRCNAVFNEMKNFKKHTSAGWWCVPDRVTVPAQDDANQSTETFCPEERPDASWWMEPKKARPSSHSGNIRLELPSAAEVLPCSQCSKAFTNREDYDIHTNWHKGISSFPCPKEGCGKILSSKHHLLAHQKSHEIKQFVCDTCGATFKSGGCYKAHLQRHQEPRFECATCGKRFTIKSQLHKHQTVHSNERKFECQVCGKKFKSYEANRVHQRIHTQEKPYACTVCDARFAYNCLLKAHLEKGHD